MILWHSSKKVSYKFDSGVSLEIFKCTGFYDSNAKRDATVPQWVSLENLSPIIWYPQVSIKQWKSYVSSSKVGLSKKLSLKMIHHQFLDSDAQSLVPHWVSLENFNFQSHKTSLISSYLFHLGNKKLSNLGSSV